MVILENSATDLKLRHQPQWVWAASASLGLGMPLLIIGWGLISSWIYYLWWIPLLIFFFVISGIGLFLWLDRIIILHFHKPTHSFQINCRRLFSRQVMEYHLAEIWDVQAEPISWNKSSPNAYQLVIVLKEGDPLHLYLGDRSSHPAPLEVLQMIRRFLKLRGS